MKAYCITIIFALLGLYSYSQEYTFHHLTIENGLPSNRVYDIFKDSKGFMWFCTDLGVCRYNGLEIETFTTEDGLADNDIFNCFEDKWGRIWFASYNGELSFFRNEVFYNKKNCQWLQIVKSKSFIRSFIQNEVDSSFNIIFNNNFSTYWQVHFDSISYKKLTPPKFVQDIKNSVNVHVHFIKDNTFNQSIMLDDADPERNITITNKDSILGHKISQVSNRFILANSKIFLFILDRLYDCSEEKFYKTSFSKKNLQYVYHSPTDTMYGYKTGLEIIHNKRAKEYLLDEHITGISEDSYNNLYVSTYQNGVFIGHFQKQKVKTLKSNMNYVTTLNGKKIFASKNNTIYEIITDQSIIPFSSEQRLLNKKYTNDHITSLLTWRDQLIVNSEKGSARFLNSNGKIIQKNVKFSPGPYNTKYTIFNELLFVHDSYWVHTYDLATNEKIVVLFSDSYKQDLNTILCMAQDNNRFLGIASRSKFYEISKLEVIEHPHLSRLNLEKFTFINHQLIGINNNNRLIRVKNYKNESLAETTSILNSLRIKDLKKISPSALIIRDNKNINWLLTLKKEKVEIHQLNDYAKRPSLTDINSDSVSLYINQNNYAFIVPIESSFISSWTPKVFLKKFKNGERLLEAENREYTIPYSERNNISVTYSFVSKFKQDYPLFEYSISRNKTDTNWLSTNQPNLKFLSPTFGTYYVHFRAKNKTGHYSRIISNKITIKHPYYLTWWFILSILASTAGLTFIITKGIQKTKEKKEIQLKEDEKKFIEAEFKSLNALMNPHFIFNSLNNIQGFINTDSKENANKYLEIFAQLVRQNMHNIKDGSISLEKEMNLVRNYLALEKMRFKEKIRYKLNIDDGVELEDIFIPPLTIQPIIENSIKHGILPLKNRIGEIEISLSQIDNHVKIEVSDNGIGLSKDKKSAGNRIALKAIKERFVQIEKMTGYPIEFNIQNRIYEEQIIGAVAEISIQIPNPLV